MMATLKKDRVELEENLIAVIKEIKTDKEKVKKVKNGLKPHRILAGDVQKWFANPEKAIPQIEEEKLYFLTEQVYLATNSSLIMYTDYFTPREVKEIKTTFEGYKSEEIKFPYTFKNAQKLNDGWVFLMSVTEARLLNSGSEIQYNPNVQRSSKVEKREDKLIPIPKIYKSKLAEIEDLFLRNKLKTTTLTFNARLGSAEDENLGEVIFDEETGDLTITKGTLFDCIDGYHRLTATTKAQENNKEVDMMFIVKLSNTHDAGAKEEFTQINKVTPVHKAQRDRMDQEKFENFIIERYLREDSEIKDKIVSENTVNYKSENLVSYSILNDAIAETFKIKNKGEALKVGQYLKEFINEICYTYPDEFIGDKVVEAKAKSLVNANIMFFGYITLCGRFYQDGLSPSYVSDILSGIDFSRENKLWIELNVIDAKGSITNAAKKGLIKYFQEINI